MSDSAPRVPWLPLPRAGWRPGKGRPPHGPAPEADASVLFAHGADLFDASCWWEAHEVWELIWRDLPPGPDREALQGMIQAAAHLLRREDPRTRAAAERLKQRAIGRLQVWLDVHGPSYRGVDLQALRDALLGPSHAPPRLLALRNDPASEVP